MTTEITWTGGTINLDDMSAREIGVKSNDTSVSKALGVTQGQRNFSPRTIGITCSVIDWTEKGPAFLDLMNDVGRDTPFTFSSTELGTLTVRLAGYPGMTKGGWMLGSYGFLLEEHLAS